MDRADTGHEYVSIHMKNVQLPQYIRVKLDWIVTLRIDRPVPFMAAYRHVLLFWVPSSFHDSRSSDAIVENHCTVRVAAVHSVRIRRLQPNTSLYSVTPQAHGMISHAGAGEFYHKWLLVLVVQRLRFHEIRTENSLVLKRDLIGDCQACLFCRSQHRTILNLDRYELSQDLMELLVDAAYEEQKNLNVKFPTPVIVPTHFPSDLSNVY